MRKCCKSGRGERGGSLVELLVGLAISITVIGVTMSLLIGGMGITGRVRQQTDQYESLRLAGSMFQADAKMAFIPALHCTSTSLMLYTLPDMSKAIEYSLQPHAGTSQYDLHRIQWKDVPASGDPYSGGGATQEHDYVVAEAIDQPTQSGADVFGCYKGSTYPQGGLEIVLEKPLLTGQAAYTTVQVFAFPRNK